jgi:hypothetical protein
MPVTVNACGGYRTTGGARGVETGSIESGTAIKHFGCSSPWRSRAVQDRLEYAGCDICIAVAQVRLAYDAVGADRDKKLLDVIRRDEIAPRQDG